MRSKKSMSTNTNKNLTTLTGLLQDHDRQTTIASPVKTASVFTTTFASVFAITLAITELTFTTPAQAQDLPLRGLEANKPDRLTAQTDNAEEIKVSTPSLQALISVNSNLNPLLLDAQSQEAISLAKAADLAIKQNLDLSIANYNERSKHAALYSNYGKFLPDIKLAYQWNYLKGKANVPFGSALEPLSFNNPFILTSAGFKYYGYRGGSVLFGTAQAKNNLKAASFQKKATLADTLQQAAKLYYDLVLQEALLQIRIKAVETSTSQLSLNQDLRTGGMATNLEVLQARTQLFQDRQNLIDQQILRREAAIKLAQFLNLPQEVDLSSGQPLLKKMRLLAGEMQASSLLQYALDNRAEIKQYEELRLAAKKQIVINAAKLQPNFAFSGNVLGIGETLGRSTELSPITLPGATGGAGGIGIRQRQITALYTLGFNLNWNFEGLGTVDLAKIHEAKLEARKAQLEQVKVLNDVISQVRRSYLRSLQTERKIEETMAQVESSEEELRLAQLRFQNGLGKNIDVLKAQQDYTSSLIEKARALVNFNNAQVDLLRDTGLISYSRLIANQPTVK
jgi:outer membrane protein TolC